MSFAPGDKVTINFPAHIALHRQNAIVIKSDGLRTFLDLGMETKWSVQRIELPTNALEHYNPKLSLGYKLDFGTVIAYGYFTDDEYSLMVFLDPEYRIPSVANYMVCNMWTSPEGFGPVRNCTVYPNIVPAAMAYSDEYGMDY